MGCDYYVLQLLVAPTLDTASPASLSSSSSGCGLTHSSSPGSLSGMRSCACSTGRLLPPEPRRMTEMVSLPAEGFRQSTSTWGGGGGRRFQVQG